MGLFRESPTGYTYSNAKELNNTAECPSEGEGKENEVGVEDGNSVIAQSDGEEVDEVISPDEIEGTGENLDSKVF